MVKRPLSLFILPLVFCCAAFPQGRGSLVPNSPGFQGSMIGRGPVQTLMTNVDMWSVVNANKDSPTQGASGSVSALDLKAPAKARREYNKGYLLLMQKDFNGAVEQLLAAIATYPKFVAAHNALGSAYLQLGQSRQARDEFAGAISLDDHLPGAYLNLGCAQLALEDYASAVDSVQKASLIAPLDLQVSTTLSYAQFMNQDYAGVITTARQVHGRKHNGAAMVHYYAAAAFQRQSKITETENELQTFLSEDPKSSRAEQARKTLDEIKSRENQRAVTSSKVARDTQGSEGVPKDNSTELQLAKQEAREQGQIAEAEAMDLNCLTCTASSGEISKAARRDIGPKLPAKPNQKDDTASDTPFSLHSTVDEVAVIFAATDHGRPVTNLTRGDVAILDSQTLPKTVTGFRNESELPLRLGIVIDTSESVTSQFSFEQRAAIHFLHGVLANSEDLAFVVGVSNSVLMVQDYTNDQDRIAHAVNELAPSGGTALWDAVSFAAHKLSARPETQPVARLLIVISDGKDNSSTATLKEAIATAETGDVFVYTLGTGAVGEQSDPLVDANPSLVGTRAMRLLAERTGGASLAPRTLGGLDSALASLQEVIRSRYLISYKPAGFKPDGSYHAITISANQSGHKLRIYARKGYYAQEKPINSDF